MTERLADIAARLDHITQLDAVVTAMRGIAAAQAQQSRSLLSGIDAYASAVSHAIGKALDLIPPASTTLVQNQSGRAIILFAAERGFAGAFSDRVLDEVGTSISKDLLLLIGSRGTAIARERGLSPTWTCPMASQIGGVPAIANRTAEALYAQIAAGRVSRAEVFFPCLDEARRVTVTSAVLFPLDIKQFRTSPASIPPLTNLDSNQLLEQLTAEYVYARLCEAAMQSFAAENQARMDAMGSASSNIERIMTETRAQESQVRQEEVTAEIIELAAGIQIDAPLFG